MAAPAGGQRGQSLGLLQAVVHAVDHHVFEAHPAPRARGEATPRRQQHLQRPLAVQRHQLVTQRVVGRVQADGQVHLRQLVDHAVDPRHHARRADRDVACADPQPLRVVQQAHRLEHAVGVVQRLAHAHEDDVVVAAARARTPVGAKRQPRVTVPVQHLVDDLARRQLAAEPGLAGGAERAAHRAARLAGDADRGPRRRAAATGVAHQDRLDALPVGQLVDGLGGQAAIGLQHVAAADGAEPEGSVQVPAQAARQVGDLAEARHLWPVDARHHLGGPIRRLAAGLEPRGERR